MTKKTLFTYIFALIGPFASAGNDEYKPLFLQVKICGAILEIGAIADTSEIRIVDGEATQVRPESEIEFIDELYSEIKDRSDQLWQLMQTTAGANFYTGLRGELGALIWHSADEDYVRDSKATFSIWSEEIETRNSFEPFQVKYSTRLDIASLPAPMSAKQTLYANVDVLYKDLWSFRRALDAIHSSFKARKASANLTIDPKTFRITFKGIELETETGLSTFSYLMRKIVNPFAATYSSQANIDRIQKSNGLEAMKDSKDDLINLVNFPNGEIFLRKFTKPLRKFHWTLTRTQSAATLSAIAVRDYLGPVEMEITSSFDSNQGQQVTSGQLTFKFPNRSAYEDGSKRAASAFGQYRPPISSLATGTRKRLTNIKFLASVDDLTLKVSNFDLSDPAIQKLLFILVR